MPKMIYAGEKPAAAILEGDDIARVVEALRYFIDTPWGNASERGEFERILRDLNAPAPN